MRKVALLLAAAVIAVAALGGAGRARAADAAQAWGTVSTPGQQFVNSALLHQSSGTIAQQVEAGRDSSPFKSVTSCGTCTTITITGNNNSVSGNSITSTNSGTVSSTGIFNFDSF
jgi:hypothetical protein